MSANARDSRPLSPHLQVWRWHVTMLTSILHRATGVALYVGAIVVTIWLVALAAGPDAFAGVEALLLGPIGVIVMVGFTAALTYHLANGVRHLFWDAGKGFSPSTASATGWATLIFAAVATAAIWLGAMFIGS